MRAANPFRISYSGMLCDYTTIYIFFMFLIVLVHLSSVLCLKDLNLKHSASLYGIPPPSDYSHSAVHSTFRNVNFILYILTVEVECTCSISVVNYDKQKRSSFD